MTFVQAPHRALRSQAPMVLTDQTQGNALENACRPARSARYAGR